MMESDSWLDQCASSDLIGFSSLYQRVSLAQDPAPLLGRDGVSSERAYGAALPTQMAGDGVQHGRETPREQASWSCVSSCYTEVSRHMFPGRAPILQWGIKKGNAQSFSVQEERTTPPRHGGRGAAMVVPGQRKMARLAAEQWGRYLAHVNTCRLRGGPS